MAVLLADLLAPRGPLERDFFPDEPTALDTRLQEYINRAEAKVASYPVGTFTDTDGAVAAYALHLSFEAAYLIKSNAPASASMQDLGSTAFNKEQIAAFQAQALRYLQQFEGMVAAASAPTGGSGSRAVRNVYSW